MQTWSTWTPPVFSRHCVTTSTTSAGFHSRWGKPWSHSEETQSSNTPIALHQKGADSTARPFIPLIWKKVVQISKHRNCFQLDDQSLYKEKRQDYTTLNKNTQVKCSSVRWTWFTVLHSITTRWKQCNITSIMPTTNNIVLTSLQRQVMSCDEVQQSSCEIVCLVLFLLVLHFSLYTFVSCVDVSMVTLVA